MKKKFVWLVLSGLMALALLMSACAPAPKEEAPAAPVTPAAPAVKEVAPAVKEAVPAEGKEMVKVTLKKYDGTIVEKMVEKPRYGGVFTYAINSAPIYWDDAMGHKGGWPTSGHTNEMFCTGNWAMGPAGTGETVWIYGAVFSDKFRVGALAESWEIHDPLSATFRIRKGVHWALNPISKPSKLVNGREVTADDVVFSINRYWTAPTAYGVRNYPGLVELDKVKAIDKYTVFTKWIPRAGAQLITTLFEYLTIWPREAVETYANEAKVMYAWDMNVGTGPFMLVDYVPASSLTLVRNPNYWMKDPLHPQNQLPYFDSLKVLVITDASTRLAALRTGTIDRLEGLSQDDTRSLWKTNPGLPWVEAKGSSKRIFWRMDKPELPWYDMRVRRALYMAVNFQSIVDDYYGGYAVINPGMAGPYPGFEGMWIPLEEYPESVRELYGYHPDKARQLLIEAGYPKGFKAKVVTIAADVDFLSIVKAYWAAIGVDLELDVRESGAFTAISTARSNENMIMCGDGSWVIPLKWLQLTPDVYYDHSFIGNDPKLTEYRERGMGSWPDQRAEERAVKEANPYIAEQAWWLQPPAPSNFIFWQPWLPNYHGEWSVTWACGGTAPQYMWVDQELKKEMRGR